MAERTVGIVRHEVAYATAVPVMWLGMLTDRVGGWGQYLPDVYPMFKLQCSFVCSFVAMCSFVAILCYVVVG